MPTIREINKILTDLYEQAMKHHYNLATKLSDREAVDAMVDALTLTNVHLRGLLAIAEQHDPFFLRHHKILTTTDLFSKNYKAVRYMIEQAQLEREMKHRNPVQLTQFVCQRFRGKLGDRIWPVRPEGLHFEHNDKWPYLRWVRHVTHHNVVDVLGSYASLEDEVADAFHTVEILDNAAKKANSSLWLNGADLQTVFPGI